MSNYIMTIYDNGEPNRFLITTEQKRAIGIILGGGWFTDDDHVSIDFIDVGDTSRLVDLTKEL